VGTKLVDEITHDLESDALRPDSGVDLRDPRPYVLMLLNENARVALVPPTQSGNQVGLLGLEVGSEARAALWPQSMACHVVVCLEGGEQLSEKRFKPLVIQREVVGHDSWNCFHGVFSLQSER
jgi:hypothetical protein